MRNVIYVIMILIIIMVGCSDKSHQLVDYDKEKVSNSLNQLSFEPEVPNLLPFETKETKIDVMNIGGMKKNFIAVSFINKNREKITFHAGTNQNTIDFTEEKVKIQKNLNGKYGGKG